MNFRQGLQAVGGDAAQPNTNHVSKYFQEWDRYINPRSDGYGNVGYGQDNSDQGIGVGYRRYLLTTSSFFRFYSLTFNPLPPPFYPLKFTDGNFFRY